MLMTTGMRESRRANGKTLKRAANARQPVMQHRSLCAPLHAFAPALACRQWIVMSGMPPLSPIERAHAP
jgi:hypothetical protein